MTITEPPPVTPLVTDGPTCACLCGFAHPGTADVCTRKATTEAVAPAYFEGDWPTVIRLCGPCAHESVALDRFHAA